MKERIKYMGRVSLTLITRFYVIGVVVIYITNPSSGPIKGTVDESGEAFKRFRGCAHLQIYVGW